MKEIFTFDMQLFAEGGAAAGTGEGAAAETSAPVVAGKQAADADGISQDSGEESGQGDSPDLLLENALGALAERLGVDKSDPAALAEAIERALEAKSGAEGETAEAQGPDAETPPEDSPVHPRGEEALRQLYEDMAEERALEEYGRLMTEAAEIKKLYPRFDVEHELRDGRFKKLLEAGIGMRAAYEALHADRIIPAAMLYAARAVEKRLSAAMLSTGSRPAENAVRGHSTAVLKNKVANMSREQRQAMILRAKKGERISF